MTGAEHAQAVALAWMLIGAAVVFVMFKDRRPVAVRSHRAHYNTRRASLTLAVALTAPRARIRQAPVAPRALERTTAAGRHAAAPGRMVRVPLAPPRPAPAPRPTSRARRAAPGTRRSSRKK